jgi:hypothetical protein
MKLMNILLAPLLFPVAGFASDDLTQPKIIYKETFTTNVNAQNGAVHCQNKFHSGFGDFSGSISMSNHGTRYGNDRVQDRADRVSRIDDFGMKLPDSVTCESLESQIPRGNISVEVKREIQAELITGKINSRLLLKEIVTLPLSKDIVLTGTATWKDFQIPSVEIASDREYMLLLLDQDDFKENLSFRLRPLNQGMDCRPAKINNGSFQLTMQLNGTDRLNTTVVSRVFKTESDCVDKLSAMLAELSVSDLDSLGLSVSADRELQLIRRERFSDGSGRQTDLVRTELISLSLLGVEFSGAKSMPLWPVN